jgi:galactonate dehydratase
MQPQPTIVNGYLQVPTAPGLGIDIVEDAIAHYPSTGNIAPANLPEYTYFRAREQRAAWLQPERPRRTEDFV